MPVSRTPSRASTAGSGPTTVDAQATALVGALQAFGRPPPKPQTASNTGSGVNGALAAAAWAGSKNPPSKPRSDRSPGTAAPPQPTPAKTQPLKNPGPKGSLAVKEGTIPKLSPPRSSPSDRSPSPSNYVAKVAAARSASSANPGGFDNSVRPPGKVGQGPGTASRPQQERKSASKSPQDDSTDATPIPPTTSLVDLFERKSSVRERSAKTPEPVLIKPDPDVPIQSPKPVRHPEGGITAVFKMELEEDNIISKPAEDMGTKDYAQLDGRQSPQPNLSPSADSGATSSPITIRKRPSQLMSATADVSSPPSIGNRLRPSPSPYRYPSTDPPSSRSPARSVTSPPHMLSASRTGDGSLAAQYRQMYPRHKAPLSDESALANAIVASSLASSRVASPKVTEPPPVPNRRRHHTFSFSRTPSPSKHAMKHTLRKKDSSESDGSDDELHPYGKHKKKRHLRKHPNKHHEGDRKRWRDAITERERRRYEGVWAANKGIHCSLTIKEENSLRIASKSKPPPAVNEAVADSVSNIIVRDIWNRSRLPEAVLESVWDLVDTDEVGRLTKDEFVVGMWLIDQRLKGRKLPVKVTDFVWASARNIQGIKIRR